MMMWMDVDRLNIICYERGWVWIRLLLSCPSTNNIDVNIIAHLIRGGRVKR